MAPMSFFSRFILRPTLRLTYFSGIQFQQIAQRIRPYVIALVFVSPLIDTCVRSVLWYVLHSVKSLLSILTLPLARIWSWAADLLHAGWIALWTYHTLSTSVFGYGLFTEDGWIPGWAFGSWSRTIWGRFWPFHIQLISECMIIVVCGVEYVID